MVFTSPSLLKLIATVKGGKNKKYVQCTMWKNEEFTLIEKKKKKSSNQLLSNFFSSRDVIFTKFLSKICVKVNFRNFHCACKNPDYTILLFKDVERKIQ